MVARVHFDAVPENLPAIAPITSWLDALSGSIRAPGEAKEEGTYSRGAAMLMRSQFLRFCAFVAEGIPEKSKDRAKALNDALVGEGKVNLCRYLDARSRELNLKSLTTLASNLRAPFLFFLSEGLSTFDPAEVRTPDPNRALTSLPLSERMLAEKYPDEGVRVVRRHELSPLMTLLRKRAAKAMPKAEFTWRGEELALEAIDAGKDPGETLTGYLIENFEEFITELFEELESDGVERHFVSTIRLFVHWVCKNSLVECDGNEVAPYERSPTRAAVRKRRKVATTKRKSKAKAKAQAKRAEAKCGGKPPAVKREWAGLFPSKFFKRHRETRFPGIEALLSARDEAVTALMTGPLELSLSQVCLLTREGFSLGSGRIAIPNPDGSFRKTELDGPGATLVSKYLSLIGASPVAGVWREQGHLFAARDGYRLVFDDSDDRSLRDIKTELGLLITRNRVFTEVMREFGLTFTETCALRRADVERNTLGSARKKMPKRQMSPALKGALDYYFQLVRISRFGAFWNTMEKENALFFAADWDDLTA